MSMTVFWLIAFIVFAVGEGLTVGLVSIWFAIGALGGMAKDERAFWPQVPEARRPGRDGLGNKPF